MPRSASIFAHRVAGLMAAALSLAAASVAHGASLQQVSNWTGGAPNLPSDVQMYIYVPEKVVTNPPVLTLIHSCDSNASVVLGQASGLKSTADQYGFIIVVPQSNPTSLRCWTTDSTQVWTRNDGGDSNAIKQMVVYALSKYQANADRVYVTGCSSGAMMTELLLALYPDIFKAGSSFAGMPAGCHGPNDNTSNATGYNGTCAGGPISSYTAEQWGNLVRAMDPGYTGHRPRLQLFHGSADPTISYSNMAESEEQYINLLGLGTNPTKTNTGLKRRQRHLSGRADERLHGRAQRHGERPHERRAEPDGPEYDHRHAGGQCAVRQLDGRDRVRLRGHQEHHHSPGDVLIRSPVAGNLGEHGASLG
jgi:acetylxylan esterase